MKTKRTILLSSILLLLLVRFEQVETQCANSFFDCGNGRCIARFFECDGDNDCGNFADESDCDVGGGSSSPVSVVSCPAGQFSCNDSLHTCIPSRWVCDGMNECSNGADESNCTVAKMKITCGSDFVCDSMSQCIPQMWKCDGVLDCDDGSDENKCDHIKDSASIVCDKEHGRFQCNDGKCIEYANVCNNHKDCSAGEDEGVLCHLKSCQDKKCSHICLLDPKTNSSVCYCPPGFKLLNNQTCIDFDECSDNQILNVCSQACWNLEGSFKCTCYDDYELVRDETNSTDVCRVKGDSPLLFYSSGDVIGAFDIRKKTSSVIAQAPPADTIVAMDVHVGTRKLFYLSSNLKSIGSVNVAEIGGNLWSRSLYHESIKSIEGIAVDWLNGHYYLTESHKHSIIVCNIDSQVCTTLLSGLNNPRGIVVLPFTAKLYWSEWGDDGAIFEANMDSTGLKVLIPDLKWPNDLAYDEVKNRLYWCDGKDGIIEYYDFNTKLRHVVLHDPYRQPFSLAVFEDKVYWSDWTSETLESCDKITGHHIKRVGSYNRRVFGIAIFHPTMQSLGAIKAYNPCEINTCSHICLLASTSAYSCHCPNHMKLDTRDNRTCLERDNQTFALVTTGSKFFKYYIDDINSKHTEQVPIVRHFQVGSMAYNLELQDLYVSDRSNRRIGVLHLGRYSSHRWEVLFHEGLEEILDIKFDVNTNSIYWVDYFRGTLEVGSIDGKYRAVIVRDLSKPVSLAIDASLGFIYIGERGKVGAELSKLKRVSMDGSNVKVLLSSHSGVPMSLALHKPTGQLIWADPALQAIKFFSLRTNKVLRTIRKSASNVNSIAVLGDWIFWTDLDSNRLFYTTLSGANKTIYNRVIEADKFDDNFNIKVIEARKQPVVNDRCQPGKHRCQQLCLLSTGDYACKCTLGYRLKSDGHTCQLDTDYVPVNVSLPVQQFEDPLVDLNFDTDKLDDWSIPPTQLSRNNTVAASSEPLLEKKSSGPTFAIFCLRVFYLLVICSFGYLAYRLLTNPSILRPLTERISNLNLRGRVQGNNNKQVRFFANPRYDPGFFTDVNDNCPEKVDQPVALAEKDENEEKEDTPTGNLDYVTWTT